MGSSPTIAMGVALPHAEISFTLFSAGEACVPPCLQMSGHSEIAFLLVAFFIAVR